MSNSMGFCDTKECFDCFTVVSQADLITFGNGSSARNWWRVGLDCSGKERARSARIFKNVQNTRRKQSSTAEISPFVLHQQHADFRTMWRCGWRLGGFEVPKVDSPNIHEMLFQVRDACASSHCNRCPFIRCVYCKAVLFVNFFFMKNEWKNKCVLFVIGLEKKFPWSFPVRSKQFWD